MPKARTSPIWRMPTGDFTSLVQRSGSCGEVLDFFGFNRGGNNWKTVKDRCICDGISTAHFDGKKIQREAAAKGIVPLNEVLVKNSSYSRSTLKKRLLKEGLLENKCSICELAGEWNGSPLIMILDHKNGIYNDHRFSNLRMVCPNCNSQLPTFCGRHTSIRLARANCGGCGKKLTPGFKFCRKCSPSNRKPREYKRKTRWPDTKALLAEVEQVGKCGVARRLGVSETAVRKMIKRMEFHSGIV